MAAEIFEESLVPYIQKILNILMRKVKEGRSDLHPVISETLGQLVFHIVDKGDSFET